MKISTKGRYAARAMVEMAASYDVRNVPASEIAENQGISQKYLESLLASLKSVGLIVSARGKHGGYSLARPPSEINMYEVLSCLEDSLDIVHCINDPSRCHRLDICVTRNVWAELKTATERILKRTYLDDLLQQQEILKSRKAEQESGQEEG
jgi:Rrf2 family protein